MPLGFPYWIWYLILENYAIILAGGENMKLDNKYVEKVYAGVLGKIIGVYLGRPFEGWTYERIMGGLGEINYYVHENWACP